MLRASGLKDEDFSKPLIGVANTWIEIGPCNFTCANSRNT
jgi:dihydroxy-acid dehydratase